MNPSNSLNKLFRTIRWRLESLKRVSFRAASPRLADQEINRQIAFTCIETHTAWSNFIRAYYLSLIFQPRTVHNLPIRIAPPRPISSPTDALDFAIRYLKNQHHVPAGTVWQSRDEPSWFPPETLKKLSREVRASNQQNIEFALNFQTDTFRVLPKFRHYFAHRNRDLATIASNFGPAYGTSAKTRPWHILTSCHNRRDPLIVEWLDDLLLIAQTICD